MKHLHLTMALVLGTAVLFTVPAMAEEEVPQTLEEQYALVQDMMRGFGCPEKGSVISFETKDLDGNDVTSEELFARNKYTMVDLWGTYCQPCLEKLPELEVLKQEYESRGIGIVACCVNADDDEDIQAARDLTGDYSFTKLAWSDSMDSALPYPATPFAYYVDSEGRIVVDTFEGGMVKSAREVFEMLADENFSPEDSEQLYYAGDSEDWAAEESGPVEFKVMIVDQNSDPVPGAIVSFCTDTSCNMIPSDEDGVASFEGASDDYHVSILSVPEGYSYDENEENTAEVEDGLVVILVTKE